MSELHERHRRVIPNWVALYYDDPLELVSGRLPSTSGSLREFNGKRKVKL